MAAIRGGGHIERLEKNKPNSKCRKWRLRVCLGKDLATGKYIQKARHVTGTYSEAQNAMRDFIAELEGDMPVCGRTTFPAYSQSWLERRKDTMANGTWRKNVDHVKCLEMHFKYAYLDEITAGALEKAYKAMMAGKSPSGRKLSGTYVGCIATTMYKLMDDAIKAGYIGRNPCADAWRPKKDTAPKKALSTQQIHDLVEVLDVTEPSAFVVSMCIRTGMRRGEVHGLNVGDIEGDVLHISRNMDDAGNLKATKTKNSQRDLPMTSSIAVAIAKRLEKIERDFAAANEKFGLDLHVDADTPLVCNEIGERQAPHGTSTWWRRNRARFGLEGWTVHELRHSFLSELARRKVEPKVLQQLAGHASFNTTMDIYVHVDMEQKRQAAALIDW